MKSAPRAPQRPHEITRHGDTRVDPYYWLMDRDNEEVLAHLRSENDFVRTELGHLSALQSDIFAEIKSHVEETDTSVPVRKGSWWHFERTREGLSYPVSCRAPVSGDGAVPPTIDPLTTVPGEQIVLDENIEAAGHDFLSVGVLAVSPDDRWVAVGVDFAGHERHTLTVRPLDGQAAPSEAIPDVYYGFAWAADSTHFFYTTVDDAMRPHRLWRHQVGTDPTEDVLVYEEPDAQFTVSVGRSRDDAVIVVQLNSSMTTEARFLSAHRPNEDLQVLDVRQHGVEYAVEHFIDADETAWWLKVTNEGATDFRLLARRESDTEWTEVVAERAGVRLDGVDAFQDFWALSERCEGSAAVRIVPLTSGRISDDVLRQSYLVRSDVEPSTVVLSANPERKTTQLRVVVTSLVTPRLVADVDVATGRLDVRKQQIVPGGFDESHYVTGRLWVSASDGHRIPVSLVARRDLVEVDDVGTLRATSPQPLLLYGYGSYEISIDPSFSPSRLSLLDRGIIFAIAHIRGGGEMGRSWYEMGKLAQKPTTFSDFVAVARHLVELGWTSSDQLAARGGSAGGLLMGAVVNLAPELFKCVVAEVPFVDALTTMLNDTLPLTVGEWEEWGNPDASPTAYRTMKSYSPYDNVVSHNADGTARTYPHVYATGGLNDSRVGFWEPAKWVLALRSASDDNVAYLKTEMGTGHAGPSGRYDAWRDESEVLSYVVSEITRR